MLNSDAYKILSWRRSKRSTKTSLNATILHLLGLDHRKLTYLHSGRRFRLTDVAGKVIHEVLG